MQAWWVQLNARSLRDQIQPDVVSTSVYAVLGCEKTLSIRWNVTGYADILCNVAVKFIEEGQDGKVKFFDVATGHESRQSYVVSVEDVKKLIVSLSCLEMVLSI